MLTLDATSGELKLTNLSQIFAGGAQEIDRLLRESIRFFRERRIDRITDIGTSILIALFFGSILYIDYKNRRNLRKLNETMSREQERISKERQPKIEDSITEQGSPECFVCLENLATQILAPCNHMCLCLPCMIMIKYSENNLCPLCRREVDYERVVEIKREEINKSNI